MYARLFATFATLSTLLILPVGAAERSLRGPEIDTLIKGNTIVGHSDKGDWKQFFDNTGGTAYVRGSEPLSRGEWKIKADKFCSQWPPNEAWICYDVTGDLDANPKTITWIGDSGTKYPGTVQPGNGM